MYISKPLDYFETKLYNFRKGVDIVNDLLNYDLNIEKIALACYLPAGYGKIVHTNRKNHGFAIHLDGEKEYIFEDGKKIVVKANDIIYMPKASTYAVSVISPGECYAINFDIYDDKAFEPFVLNIKNHSIVTDHFHTAKKIWQTKSNGYIAKCKAELYNILYLMQDEFFSEYIPKSKYEIIKPAVEYIHQNYTKELLNIEKLSQMCNITPVYFRKIFKSFLGTSPINYINTLKISRAKELLESKMYSINDVAFLSGYTDMSHFSREFKKTTGVCPSKYIG